jgi:hypothetical protein
MRIKVSIVVLFFVGFLSSDLAGGRREVRPLELKGVSSR